MSTIAHVCSVVLVKADDPDVGVEETQEVRVMNPQEKFEAARKAAEGILAKAKSEGRGLTDAEAAAMEKYLDEAERWKAHIERADRAWALFGKALEGKVESLVGDGPGVRAADFVTRSARRMTEVAGKSFRERAAMLAASSSMKDTLIGSTVTLPGQIARDVEELPAEPTSVLELIRQEPRDQWNGIDLGDQFSYLYEAAYTNSAASVPDGAEKPESGLFAVEGVVGGASVPG